MKIERVASDTLLKTNINKIKRYKIKPEYLRHIE